MTLSLSMAAAMLSSQSYYDQYPEYQDMADCFMDNVSSLVSETELSDDAIVEQVWLICSEEISNELDTIPPPEADSPLTPEEGRAVLEVSTEARIRALVSVYRERTGSTND